MPAAVESLLACLAVLAGFQVMRQLSARLGHPPWASPVLLTALAAGGTLVITSAPLAQFMVATLPLRWLLAPALVALATVIAANRDRVAGDAKPMLLAIIGGTLAGIATALGLARLFGLDAVLVAALSTKTVTTPFAVAIMTSVNGPVALAAALAVVTGVIGALLVPPLLDRLGITGRVARALALGVAAHIVATDWLTRRDARAGGVAALAFVGAGLVASLVVPMLWQRFIR